MTLYLVRHSLAVPRKRWEGDDDDRPLTKRGFAQNEVLERWSMGLDLSAVLSSPTRRCLDTVVGIAAAHDLPVLARSELAISDGQPAIDLVAALLADEADVLICTHGENILPILRGVRPSISEKKVVAAKGSVWTLEQRGRGIVATYATNADVSRSLVPR